MTIKAAPLPRSLHSPAEFMPSDGGFVLLDQALEPIALDPGARALFHYPAEPGSHPEPALAEVLNQIRIQKPSERSSMTTRLRVGDGIYICRLYLLEPKQQLSKGPLLGLHLEPDLSLCTDPVSAVADEFRLTEREQEALRGISLGLSSKELADRMKISPNTVKVFLRMIMIKMSVTTRAGVVAKLLEYYGGWRGS